MALIFVPLGWRTRACFQSIRKLIEIMQETQLVVTFFRMAPSDRVASRKICHTTTIITIVLNYININLTF